MIKNEETARYFIWKRYTIEEDIKQVINQSISRKILFWDKE